MRKIIILEYEGEPIVEETSVTFSKSKGGGERRRTTIPKEVCERLGIKETGDTVKWIILDKEVLVTKRGGEEFR